MLYKIKLRSFFGLISHDELMDVQCTVPGILLTPFRGVCSLHAAICSWSVVIIQSQVLLKKAVAP